MKNKAAYAKLTKMILAVVMFIGISAFQDRNENHEEANTLKVISYNIWNGFEWGKDLDRKEKLISWINTQSPDVVALQELCGYTKEKLLEDAKGWGHTYAEILKTSGYPVGITSNKPIKVNERILEDMHHGALCCTTWDVDFMVVHFSPFSYEKRRKEAEIVLEKLSKIVEDRNKYVVLGDFNAVSPFDANLYKGNADLLNSMRESEEKHSHVRNLFHGQLEYGVLSKFLGFPLIDVVQKHTAGLEQRISCPTQVFEKVPGEGRHPGSKRIDYILSSPMLGEACINAKVLNQPETFYLSDHYPVIAEFKKTKQLPNLKNLSIQYD